VTPCSVLVEYQYFEGPCCLHIQGEVLLCWEVDPDIGAWSRSGRNMCKPMGKWLNPANCPEDGGSKDLQNISILLQHNMALQPRRSQCH